MKKTLEEMARINKQLEGLSENVPSDLQKIIMFNTMLLQPLGKMYGNATKEYKYAYSQRKYAYGTLLVHSDGTGVVKEGQAEVGSKEAREKEAEAEGEMVRWKFAYDSTKELIHSQKLVLRAMVTELQNTNNMG